MRRAVGLQLLTSSRLKAWRRCARYHRLRYDEGIRPVGAEDAALRFGTLMHAALEVYWRALLAGQHSEAALLAALAALAASEADPYEHAKASALMQGYAARWADDGERYEVIAVEVEFNAPLTNPATNAESRTFRLAGKIDVLVRDRSTGEVWIVEHKTSSEDLGAGSTYWQRLKLDGQVSAYYVGAASLGYSVAGCLYDVIGKVGLKPLRATPPESRRYNKDGSLDKRQRLTDETPAEYEARILAAIAEAPDDYYRRGEVVRLEEEMARHLRDTWAQALAIRHAQREQLAPTNPDACMQWNRRCEYLDACVGEASIDDPARFVRVEEVHPELAHTAPPTREESDHATAQADQ